MVSEAGHDAQTATPGAAPRPGAHVHDAPPFYEEEDLRDWLAARPEVLPSVETRPAVSALEVGVPRMAGRIDVLVVDLDGAITVVECKLAKNPEQHAAVVGQVLSYAAGLSDLRYEDIRQKLERRAGPLAAAFQGDTSWDEEAFRRDLSRNLAAGRMHLVIAADEASDALRRTIEFVGAHMPAFDLQLCEFGNALGPFPKRPGDLVKAIRARSDEAADTAQALWRWAEAEPRLQFELKRHEGVIRARGTVCRIKRHSYLRVSLDTISHELGPSGARRVELLRRQLEDMGFEVRGGKARLPLEGVRIEEFLTLIGPVVENLPAGSARTEPETRSEQ